MDEEEKSKLEDVYNILTNKKHALDFFLYETTNTILE